MGVRKDREKSCFMRTNLDSIRISDKSHKRKDRLPRERRKQTVWPLLPYDSRIL